MSVMRCSQCERMVDTDKEDFDFDNELCEECWMDMKLQEHKELREEK